MLIGLVAGAGAIVFYYAIDRATWLFLGQMVDYVPPLPRGEGATVAGDVGRSWVLPLVVALGGLLSGLIVFTLAPEAEGHGTDAAIEAFHQRAGRIRGRIPFIKLVASAVTIGSGGSAGREGPTAQIAAGFGSWLGDIFQLSPSDRRIALAVGVGAGIGSIFKAPLGGAILSAEILYVRDFELEALVPGFIASVVGYTVFGAWAGWDPVFGNGLDLKFNDPANLPWYVLLGVACAIAGIAYVRVFYGMRDLFHRLRIPPHFKPAIAGLGVGLVGLAFPQVLSMGYGWLQFALEGNTVQLATGTLLILVALKIVATSLTIGSGGSGGVFAPGLFIGGMLGGGLWGLLNGHVPGLPPTPAPFVVVGMMALFGGIAKAPIAVILMVAEMTNEFSMVIPAMLATVIAYLISGETRIYESQVDTRADSPAHWTEYVIPMISMVTVGEAMRPNVEVTSPGATIDSAIEHMERTLRRGLPVVSDGRLVGMFTASDAVRARQNALSKVEDVMSQKLFKAYPSESLHEALRRMTSNGISRLPVVMREQPDRMIGIIGTGDIAAALDARIASTNFTPQRATSQDDPLRRVLVRDAMSQDMAFIDDSASPPEAASRLTTSGAHSLLVRAADGTLQGVVTLRDMERCMGDSNIEHVSEIMARDLIVARPYQTVAHALSQPGAESVRQLPVVEEKGGRRTAVGLLRRSDVVAAYLRSRDREELGPRAPAAATATSNAPEILELTLQKTDSFSGMTLSQLALPPEAVITTLTRNGRLIIPRGNVRLEAGDQIQLLATPSARAAVLEMMRNGARAPD